MTMATCIALVVGGTQIVLPAAEITLRWSHSVERAAWEEDYRATPEGVVLYEARIEAVGAGMEPPASAVREGKWWRYRPSLPVLPIVAFANSGFAGGYTICWSGRCRLLDVLVAQDDGFALRTDRCAAGKAAPHAWATP
jgi:hypothetical protein